MSAGYFFMWHTDGEIAFCVQNDTFCVRQTLNGQVSFSYPCGRDEAGMLERLIDYVKERDLPLRFFDVTPELLERIRQNPALQPMRFAYERRWSDYLYECEAVIGFRGKAFSGQRNHINRFKALYGEPEIRFLDSSDVPAILKFLDRYQAEHTDARALETEELEHTRRLIGAFEALRFYCAGLFTGGELCAFSIGELVGDTLMIHVEKALKTYPGAYPTMYQGFARLMRARLGDRLVYLNREDDAGDLGLRTSKMQYHPVKLIDKYLVHAFSPAARINEFPTLAGEGVVLDELRETDRSAYFALNTDCENNRFWGYDYKEDPGLVFPVNEDTFYESARYDTACGDSINFAIRERAGGELIGEAILWNFTSTGAAELGCRIAREHQHKGLGRAAFAAAADFAERTLGLRLCAKCFSENEPSRKMILSCGFHEIRRDQTYLYFAR